MRRGPIVHISTPNLGDRVSAWDATIRQDDGSTFPLGVSKATIEIDWESGSPVVAHLEVKDGFSVEAAATVQSITINGKRYQLVEMEGEQQG